MMMMIGQTSKFSGHEPNLDKIYEKIDNWHISIHLNEFGSANTLADGWNL